MRLHRLSMLMLASVVSCKLIGVQFDIEPHTLPNWPQDASKPISSTTNATLDLLCNELMDLYDIFRDKTAQNGLQFQAAIAIQYQSVFFNRNGSFVNLAQTIQQVTDKVALMAYRNVAKSIFDLAIDEVLYAATIKKKVVIPIEVLNVLPPFISFYGSTNDYMQSQVSSLHQMMIGYDGYDGTSIHHFTPYRERNPEGMTMAFGRERGMYVWDPEQWRNQTEFNQLVELCFMGDINTVYLHVGRYITFNNGQWSRLRTVISLLEQIGVDTMFLYGDSTWTINHDLPLLLMDSTIAFLNAMYGTTTTTGTTSTAKPTTLSSMLNSITNNPLSFTASFKTPIPSTQSSTTFSTISSTSTTMAKISTTTKTVIPTTKLVTTTKATLPTPTKTAVSTIKFLTTTKTVIPTTKLLTNTKTVIPTTKLLTTTKSTLPTTTKAAVSTTKLLTTLKMSVSTTRFATTATIPKLISTTAVIKATLAIAIGTTSSKPVISTTPGLRTSTMIATTPVSARTTTISSKVSTTTTNSFLSLPTDGVSGSCGSKFRCSSTECCSQYGYCGTTIDYCGKGCLPNYGICW